MPIMVDLSFWWLCGLSICRCKLYWTAIHTHLYFDSITNLYPVCNTDTNVGPYLYLYTYSDIYTNIHANKYSDADADANAHGDADRHGHPSRHVENRVHPRTLAKYLDAVI